MENIKIQVKHIKLLKKLNSKTKPIISKISKDFKLARKTIINNFNNLKLNNIINNFTININPHIQPNLKFVIVEIKTNPNEPQILEELLKITQLKMLDGILGEFSLIGLFIFKNTDEFNKVLNLLDKVLANSSFRKYQIVDTIKVFKTNGIKLSEVNLNQSHKVDEIDYIILKILQQDQDLKLISTYEITKIFKRNYNKEVSQSTIYHRIKKLEDYGIILNYAINFNPKKIGYNGKFIVRIKPKDSSKYNEIALKLEKKEEITDLFRIGEQYGLFAVIRVKEIEDFGKFMKGLYDSEEIEDTFTTFILDEHKSYQNFVI